jgi:hypothetical protein
VFPLCVFTSFVNIDVYFDFVRNIAVAVLFLYFLLITVYIHVNPSSCTYYYDYLCTRTLVAFDRLPYVNRL